MLTGTFRQKLTAKNRLVIPAEWRNILPVGSKVYLIKNANWIDIYNTEAFTQMNVEITKVSRFHESVQEIKRHIYGNSYLQELDNQGRILLSSQLFKQLDWQENQENNEKLQELILIGTGDHAEVWSEATWEIYSQNKSRNISDVSTRVAMLLDNFNKHTN